jgi:dihydroorotate dehydrogenase (fumarate)
MSDTSNNYIELNDIDISTTLFNDTKLNTPIYNASGVMCTTYKQLQDVLNCQGTGAVVTKSCTLSQRQGNPEPRYFDRFPNVENGSINSMGIPNNGIEYYKKGAITLERNHKPYIISVSGLCVEENLKIFSSIAEESDSNKITAIEFNLSCPNIIGKPQLCYDFDAMDNTLRKVFDIYSEKSYTKCPVGVKLSPYFDPVHFQMAADVLDGYTGKLSFLTCVNSLGNGLVIDVETESTVIYPKKGLGGIGGDFIKHTALANVRTFYDLLGDKLDIIGCGGVKNGSDVFEHILCGAKAVQVGTLVARKGVDEFNRLIDELKDLMAEKKYNSLAEFRGNLKTIPST